MWRCHALFSAWEPLDLNVLLICDVEFKECGAFQNIQKSNQSIHFLCSLLISHSSIQSRWQVFPSHTENMLHNIVLYKTVIIIVFRICRAVDNFISLGVLLLWSVSMPSCAIDYPKPLPLRGSIEVCSPRNFWNFRPPTNDSGLFRQFSSLIDAHSVELSLCSGMPA